MKQKWVKRIARGMLPCFVFFVFSFSFAPKAYAADYDGTGYFGVKVSGGATYQTSGTLPITNFTYQVNQYHAPVGSILDARFGLDATTAFTGPVKLYASYYWVTSGTNVQNLYYQNTPTASVLDASTWDVSYTNHLSQTAYVIGGLNDISTFVPSSSGALNGVGYAIEAEWSGSEAYPIRALNVERQAGVGFQTTALGNPGIVFPSIRFIATAYSEEMEALDKVADEIAAQSDILLAMKGDLVAILQDIYAMTGDIYAAQNLLNTYVAQMLPLLENIDETTTDIYSLLSTQLRLLETAIENAADSIEAAISAQTAAMIAYLESVLNTGNEVPDDTYQQQQDAANILDQMESLEKPNVDTIVPVIGDYTDSGVSGVLSAIFSSNLIVTMMTLSASFAFGAYVLFGKRE